MVRITISGSDGRRYNTSLSEEGEREKRARKVANYFLQKEGKTFRACFLARNAIRSKLEY
jgi:hypothetical protein